MGADVACGQSPQNRIDQRVNCDIGVAMPGEAAVVGSSVSAIISASSSAALAPARAGKRIHWGLYSGTTDGGSDLVVTHGAGFTPSGVIAMGSAAATNQVASSYNRTATSVTLVVYSRTGAAVPNTAVSVFCVFFE